MQGYTIRQARALLDKGKIGAAELTRYYLERAAKLSSKLNAYITIAAEDAEKDALRAQTMLDSGNQKPLTGIPIAVSDNISTKGILTTCGSKMLYNYKPVFDATVIKKLKEQGAVILGKTNVSEFCLGDNTSSFFGESANPYNVEKSAGCGAAVAVCADLAVCAISADIGGSIVQSASLCGVAGIQPTYGAVSRYGMISSAPSFSQIGAIAKDAQDCTALLSAIAGKDMRDMTSIGYKSDFANVKECNLQGKTIGIITEYIAQASTEVKAAIENTAQAFKELGCNIVQVSLPSTKYALSAYYIISSAEATSSLALYDGIRFGYRSKEGDTFEQNLWHTRGEGFGEEVKRRLLLGVFALGSGNYEKYYHKAKLVKEKLKAEFNAIFNICDFLLCPVAAERGHNTASSTTPVQNWQASAFTVAQNLVGLPCVSTACGYSKEGMPIGAQLIAPHFADAKLLACATAFEQVFAGKRKEAAV